MEGVARAGGRLARGETGGGGPTGVVVIVGAAAVVVVVVDVVVVVVEGGVVVIAGAGESAPRGERRLPPIAGARGGDAR
jgi:hypothetical protein